MELKPKKCPFCGSELIVPTEGSSFRWIAAECGECGSRGPEIRKQTVGEGTTEQWDINANIRAIKAWNNRSE